MNIVVFGANGHVGRLVVDELVARGHIVTASVHSEPALKINGVNYVQGSIYNEQDVETAIQGSEVVISCLGSWGTKRKDVLSSGMSHMVPAMKRQDVSRIISLTGADAWVEGESRSWLQKVMHAVFGLLAGKIVHDGEEHLRILSSSGLDWTVVRSPVMNEKGDPTYRLSLEYPAPWTTIHRRAVASALCDQVGGMDALGRSPYLHRS